MNHYPRHIGDYLKDTLHLSLLEHGIYTRLLDVYYTREAPIPADQAERLVGARTREEKAALQGVLSEFFTPSPEGWRQARADREIAEYREGADEREQKAAHEAERMRRFRERRKEMFATLRERGIVPKWDTSMEELQRLLNANSNGPETRTGAEQEREQVPNGNAIATANQNHNHNQKKEKSASQGSRLPADWTLPEEWKAVALAYRREWSPENVDFVAEKFRDYWHSVPGQKGRKANWLATWRNWCRDEKSVRGTQSATAQITVDL